MALGAYASTILVDRLRVPYLLSLLATAAFCGIAGAVVAVPASRFRGHYLAMATLVFQFVIIIGLREWSSITGGAAGLSVPNAELFTHSLANDGEYLVFTGLATTLAIALLAAILSGRSKRETPPKRSRKPSRNTRWTPRRGSASRPIACRRNARSTCALRGFPHGRQRSAAHLGLVTPPCVGNGLCAGELRSS